MAILDYKSDIFFSNCSFSSCTEHRVLVLFSCRLLNSIPSVLGMTSCFPVTIHKASMSWRGLGGMSSFQVKLYPLTIPTRAVFMGPVMGSEVKHVCVPAVWNELHFHIFMSSHLQGAQAMCACLPSCIPFWGANPAWSRRGCETRSTVLGVQTRAPVLTRRPANVH